MPENNTYIALAMADPANTATVHPCSDDLWEVRFGEKYVKGYVSIIYADEVKAHEVARLHNTFRNDRV